MKFWDSSAIVPLLVEEPTTRAMTALIAKDRAMLVWWASDIECASAIARLERDGQLTVKSAEQALERLETLKSSWNEIQPVEPVRRTARRLLRTHPLRTADSLQLAAALVASEGDPGSLQIVTLDARLAAAARREGFTLEPR